MNVRGFLAGFGFTLAVLAAVWFLAGGPGRGPARADGRGGRDQVPEYRRPFDATKDGLRRTLLAGLRERVVTRRYFTVRAIGDTGDRFFVPHLLGLYEKEEDVGVKGQILLALARLGGAEAERLLFKVLDSVVGPVLADAAQAVGRLPGERGLAGLAKALAAKNTFVRIRAVDGIVDAGRPDVGPLLERALADPQFKVRERVLKRLPDLPASLRLLAVRRALKAPEAALRKLALEKWLEVGAPALEPAEAVRYLDDPDPAVRAAAARGCGRLGVKAAVPKLLAAIDSKASEALLSAVAAALGDLKDPRAVPGLLRIADMQPFIPRGDALLALGRMGWRAAKERLRRELTHEKPYVRHRAALALHLLGEPGMLRFFEQSLASDDLITRANCVYTLGQDPRPEFLPILARAAREDSDPKVREVAVKGLCKLLPAPEAAAALGDVLADRAPEVRYWALWGIARHPCAQVLEVVRRATRDESWDVRRAAYRFLAAHDPQGSLPYLKRGAKDVDWRVKAEVWGKLYRILYGA